MSINYVLNTPVFGIDSTFAVTEYTETDIPYFEQYFKHWLLLCQSSLAIGSRKPILGEAFTEGLWCLWSGAVRYLSKSRATGLRYTQRLADSSLDSYQPNTHQAEQIKSSISATDCTSFGPTSKEDVIYFLHFWNDGNIDGTFDVYEIPQDILHSTILNEDNEETFHDQCVQGRRPHVGLIDRVIAPNNLKPISSKIKLW